MSTLNPRQQMFISAYLQSYNATQAAIAAGYSENTARVQGPRLLQNVAVKRALREAMSERIMTPEEVLHRLSEIGRGDMGDLVDRSGNPDIGTATDNGRTWLIKRIKHKTIVTEQSDITEDEVEVHDPLRALDLLAKYHNLTNRYKIEDWRSQAIADIKAGNVDYHELASRDKSLADELFALAGVPITDGIA